MNEAAGTKSSATAVPVEFILSSEATRIISNGSSLKLNPSTGFPKFEMSCFDVTKLSLVFAWENNNDVAVEAVKGFIEKLGG